MDEKILDQIDAYLRHELDVEEREQLERAMQEDAKLNVEVHLTCDLVTGLARRQQMLEKMKVWQRHERRRKRHSTFAVAGISLAACLMGVVYLLQQPMSNPKTVNSMAHNISTCHPSPTPTVVDSTTILNQSLNTSENVKDRVTTEQPNLTDACSQPFVAIETAGCDTLDALMATPFDFVSDKIQAKTYYEAQWDSVRNYLKSHNYEKALLILKTFRQKEGIHKAMADSIWNVFKDVLDK